MNDKNERWWQMLQAWWLSADADLKYARLELMRGQEDLLRWLIQQWDEQHHVFQIRGNELSIDKDYV